jgi:DNA-binding CsgD family transcriptional regulator
VRTHLKRMLAKTGTHRQSDLFRLFNDVAQLPAAD